MDAPHRRPGRLALAALLLSAAAAAAAQTTGTIEGVVVDADGNPLPGVTVTVAGPGVRQERITQGDGAYASAGLAAGDYVVTAVLLGFETAETPVSLEAGATEKRPGRPAGRKAPGDRHGRGRGAPDLREKPRLPTDDPAAIQHHRGDVGRGQPAGCLGPGG